MHKRVIIIIPIYKPIADKYEEISFRQCIKILSKYPICIITFKELNTDWYENILKASNIEFLIEYFDATYFDATSGYSQLMTGKELYHRFSAYKYMLLYQLDAYVFSDELDYWCKQGYDYIGAPWFNGWHMATKEITGVGNGGFSLRNIQSSLSISSKLEKIRKCKKLYTRLNLNRFVSFYKIVILLRAILKLKPSKKYLHELTTEHDCIIHEDVIWCLYIPYLFYYEIAPVEEALKFSFETNPSLLYKMNNNRLPFGCHAWEKYEPEFWQSFIKYDL